jgi:hypothetical protein
MLTRAEIPGLLATLFLVGMGTVLVVWHWKSWKRDALDASSNTPERWSQCRRRMQVAVMIALEGVLLCLGDTVLPILYRAGMISERKMAGLWTIDVLFMLLLAVWIALLALGDLAVTATGARRELRTMRQRQRELQEELERLRSRRES